MGPISDPWILAESKLNPGIHFKNSKALKKAIVLL